MKMKLSMTMFVLALLAILAAGSMSPGASWAGNPVVVIDTGEGDPDGAGDGLGSDVADTDYTEGDPDAAGDGYGSPCSFDPTVDDGIINIDVLIAYFMELYIVIP